MLRLWSFGMFVGNAVFQCLDYVFVLDAEDWADWTLLAYAVPFFFSQSSWYLHFEDVPYYFVLNITKYTVNSFQVDFVTP